MQCLLAAAPRAAASFVDFSNPRLLCVLRPSLGRVFPSSRACGLPRRRYRGLRDADGLLYRLARGQGRLAGRSLHPARCLFGQQGRGHPQRLHFLFQPRQLELFLPQNFINILHILSTCPNGVRCTVGRTVAGMCFLSRKRDWLVTDAGRSGSRPDFRGFGRMAPFVSLRSAPRASRGHPTTRDFLLSSASIDVAIVIFRLTIRKLLTTRYLALAFW